MKEITSVYGGRASVAFDSYRHRYLVTVPGVCEDLFQPSVTSILKMKDKSDALLPWAIKCFHQRMQYLIGLMQEPYEKDCLLTVLDQAKDSYREVSSSAADIGTAVHAFLEQHIKSQAGLAPKPVFPVAADQLTVVLSPSELEKANAAIDAGLGFFADHEIELVEPEAVRWSPTYGYVGTGDLIARVDGDLSVLDYKTGKRLYPEVFLQLAAYQHAYQEEHPEQKIVKRVGVNVTRDGKLDTIVRGNDTYGIDFTCFLALLTAWRWHEENVGYWSRKTFKMVAQPAPRILGDIFNN